MSMKSAVLIGLFASFGAVAAPNTYTKIGVIGGAEQYGYEISAQWEVSDNIYTFEPVEESFIWANRDGNPAYIGSINLGLTLVPTAMAISNSVDFSATFSIRTFNVATGKPVDFQYLVRDWQSVSFQTIGAYAEPLPAVRFSNMRFTGGSSIDVNGGSYTLSQHFSFVPGNYLAASDDPRCASFSCMTPMQDALRGSFGLQISAVPEPTTSVLLLAGSVYFGVVSRRRAGKSGLRDS